MITYEEYENIRDSKGMKNADVARIAHIPPSTFTDWKQGKSAPKIEKMQKIINALGIEPEENLEKESEEGNKYYFSDETAEMAQKLFEDSDMRILFDAARDSKPQDLKMAADFLKRLKETNPDG